MRYSKMRNLLRNSAAVTLVCAAVLIPMEETLADAPLAIGQGTSGGSSSALADDPQAVVEQMKVQILKEGPSFAMNGELKFLGKNRYSVNGESFLVTEETRKPERLRDGDYVRVRGRIGKKGQKTARVLTAAEPLSRRSSTASSEKKSFDGNENIPRLSTAGPR